MDKNTVLEAMEHIDPKLIEGADSSVKSNRCSINKAVLIAACVCLLLISSAIAAGIVFGTPEIEYHEDEIFEPTGEVLDGFRPVLENDPEQTKIEPVSTKIPLDCFSDAFLADVANLPEDENFFIFYFDNWSDLEAYIGYNLWDNPVLDAAKPIWFGVDDRMTYGYMSCSENDNLLTAATAKTIYHMNPVEVPSGYAGITNTVYVNIAVEASVYTEHSLIEENRMFAGRYYDLGTEITDEVYTSPNGYDFRIVRVSINSTAGAIIHYYGFACINNVYITIESTFNPSEQIALSTLKRILDGFVIE